MTRWPQAGDADAHAADQNTDVPAMHGADSIPVRQNRKLVCVCTANRADAEPRAPRHALAIAQSDMDVDVVLLDSSPAGGAVCRLRELSDETGLSRVTHYYSHRNNGIFRVIGCRAWQQLAKELFRVFNVALSDALSPYMIGIEKKLSSLRADVYVAHDIRTLVPAGRAAKKNGAALVFDCMEFYSDMGDSQTETDRRIIQALEAQWLPQCDLVLASSDLVANEYRQKYDIRKPLAIYNCPRTLDVLPLPKPEGFRLYWRNSVIGFGQRGLDDAFVALSELPGDISLHLQGRVFDRTAAAIKTRARQLGISERIFVHPPFLPEDAVVAAAEFTVGLCLEHAGVRNQELTVSNKMFDYMMAGLPVISSNLQGLAGVVGRSNGGLLYRSGDAKDLAEKIYALYSNENLLHKLANNARRFAVEKANRAGQMEIFIGALRTIPCLDENRAVSGSPVSLAIGSV